jgi:aryl-alcohol dehydrogenase-like predicted oxidoreductase
MGAVDEATAIATVHAAIDHGVTLIDTAQGYRDSEAIIGRALQKGYRNRCILATKVSGQDFSKVAIEKALDQSLRALNAGQIDLYQLHAWPTQTPIAESMNTLAALERKGKIRYLGVSNFSAEQMAQALEVQPFCANQVGYNLFDREIEADVLPFSLARGIGVIAHSPLAKGLLSGAYRSGHAFPKDDERSRMQRFRGELFTAHLRVAEALRALANDKGLTLIQLALAWVLKQPGISCVLVGAKTPLQVEEHVAAVEVQLSREDLLAIERVLEPLNHLQG